MASIMYRDLDDLVLSMEELAKLPVDVQDAMLNAGADVLVPIQRAKGRAAGVVDHNRKTGLGTVANIRKTKVKDAKSGRRISVYSQGSRKRGNTVTRNASIHFLNEFGANGVKPRPFTAEANESAADAVVAAEEAVYDQYLADNNL